MADNAKILIAHATSWKLRLGNFVWAFKNADEQMATAGATASRRFAIVRQSLAQRCFNVWGDFPNAALKARLKCDTSLNPKLSAASVTLVMRPSVRALQPAANRCCQSQRIGVVPSAPKMRFNVRGAIFSALAMVLILSPGS
jgi:hypothetical protein